MMLILSSSHIKSCLPSHVAAAILAAVPALMTLGPVKLMSSGVPGPVLYTRAATTTTTDNSTLSSLALASQTRRAISEDGRNYWKD